jgi:hypothetical protein
MNARLFASACVFAVAALLLASMSFAAFHDVCQAWDSGYYHLPFAARIAGILSEQDYAFNADNAARFKGFPLLGELLQGILWRLTGRPQAANFVCLASAPLLALSVRKLCDDETKQSTPWSVLFLAFMGIPLVMTHATSTYVDLPASAALAAAFCRLLLLPARKICEPKEALFVFVLVAISANMRLQHLVPAAFVLSVFFVRALSLGRAVVLRLAPLLLCLPIVFFVPLKNLILLGNPVYPVELSLLGHALPSAEARYSFAPAWLVHAPQPARFFASVLELGLPPFARSTEARYSVDQYLPPSYPGSRLGGTLGAGMLAFALLFAFSAWRLKARRRVLLTFAAFTALTSVLPQSHELRYTLYWPLSLAALAITTGYTLLPRATLTLSLLLPAAVALITRGEWLYPTGSTFTELLEKKVESARIVETPENGVLCAKEPPWMLLYAAKFHGRHYKVQEADQNGLCR